MKRTLTLLCALTLTAAMCLSACDSGTTTNQADTPASTADSTTGDTVQAGDDTASEDPVTISIMINGTATPGGEVHPNTDEVSVVVTEIYEEYYRRMPHVTLEFEALQGDTDGYQSYLLRGASGTLPDISNLDGYWVASFASQGYTYPLENVLTAEMLDEYYPQFKSVYKGETHGLVLSTGYNGVLWYRKSHVEEAGLTMPPASWDQLREYAAALTIPGERYGYAMPMAKTEATTCCMLGYYWGGGEEFVDSNNVAQFNNDTSKKLFAMLKGMYDDNSIPDESLTMLYDDAERIFCTGMASMLQHGSWLATGWDVRAPEFADDIGLCALPAHPDTGVSSQNAGGWGLSVTTGDTSKYPAIREFLNIMLIEPEWAKLRIAEAGEIPVTKNMEDKVDWLPAEYSDTIMDMLATSNTRPAVEIYPDASLEWDQAMQEVVAGEKDADTALADAVNRVADLAAASGWA